MKQYYVYILANEKRGTLYVGVTSDLIKRIKKWKRAWEIELIENSNPEWKDLYKNILD